MPHVLSRVHNPVLVISLREQPLGAMITPSSDTALRARIGRHDLSHMRASNDEPVLPELLNDGKCPCLAATTLQRWIQAANHALLPETHPRAAPGPVGKSIFQ